MKVGIYIAQIIPEAGGAYSFQESVLEALKNVSSRHEIYIFYYGSEHKSDDINIKYIRLERRSVLALKNKMRSIFKETLCRSEARIKEHPSYLSDAVAKNGIEFIWFMTPAFEEVSIPYIYTVWDLQHRLQPFFPEVSVTGWKWDDREKHYSKILPRAAYIFTGAEESKKEIIQFYGIDRERIKVLPLPTPSYCFHPVYIHNANDDVSSNAYESAQLLFYPAQFWPHKNHVGLLYAMKILKEKYNLKFKLIFTGADKGNLDFIKTKINELRLTDDIIIRGFVGFNELISIYKSAFAMVFPSFFGPDNLPPLEAFAFGCPVIAANVPGANEQLGDAALLVDGKDEESIALAIKALHDDMQLRSRLIDKGKLRAAGWTSVDYVNRAFETINEFEQYRRCWSSTETYINL